MKKILKALAFVLVLLQLFPALVACTQQPAVGGDSTSEPAGSDSTPEVTTEEEPEQLPITGEGFFTLFSDGKVNISSIKYPENPGDTAFEAIKKLRDKIKDEMGVTVRLSPDYSTDKNPPDSSTYEILIGEINYPESKQVHATIGYGEYAIKVVGNKLVIAAYGENEIYRAINNIIGTQLKNNMTTDKNGNKLFVVNEYAYTVARLIDDIKIGENSIREYSIVYATKENAAATEKAAEMLRKAISEKSGIVLPIIKETATCETKHKIYVGNSFKNLPTGVTLPTVEPMKAAIKIINGDFYIVGGGLLSTHMAVMKLVSKTLTQKPADKIIHLEEENVSLLKVESQPLTEGAEFRVMTWNIMAQWTGWGGDYMPVSQRFESFKKNIEIYSPDVVGLQEVSEHWSIQIKEEFGDEYNFVYQRTPDDKFYNLSTIIYKKDKFREIAKGLKYFTYNGPNQIRLVDWVILEDKVTLKKFAFFNTHWKFQESDGTNAERESHSIENVTIINDIVKQYAVEYAFSTADYNTTLEHQYCKNFLKGTGLVNTLDIAKASGNLINETGGCGSLGSSRENMTGGGSIDNIFCTPNMKVLRHETILWNGIEHVADHSPKYADIVLN